MKVKFFQFEASLEKSLQKGTIEKQEGEINEFLRSITFKHATQSTTYYCGTEAGILLAIFYEEKPQEGGKKL